MSNQHRYNEQGNTCEQNPSQTFKINKCLIIITAGHRQPITAREYRKSQDLPRCIEKHPMIAKVGLSSQGFNPMGGK